MHALRPILVVSAITTGGVLCPPLTTIVSDIGHVDFLEAVHKLAVKPYIIVGLHFDQVSLIWIILQLWLAIRLPLQHPGFMFYRR